MKVLIAEDDANIRMGICELLEDEGYEPVEAADGQEALEQFAAESIDMVILDIMMPRMNGYDVCRSIRQQSQSVPILFLSAKSEEIDKVLGLELGADDYVSKPFGVKEFVARVRALQRRIQRSTPTPSSKAEPVSSFTMKDLEVFPNELRARRGEEQIELSQRDVQILALLYNNIGKVLDRNTIFNECWGMDYFPNSRTLDQHISQLRKKIEHDPKQPDLIQTVHGVGYRYE